jgi:hypothetical protein
MPPWGLQHAKDRAGGHPSDFGKAEIRIVAAPGVLVRVGQACAQWRQVDVSNDLRQVALLLQQHGPIALLKKMTVLTKLAIHRSRMLSRKSLNQSS